MQYIIIRANYGNKSLLELAHQSFDCHNGQSAVHNNERINQIIESNKVRKVGGLNIGEYVDTSNIMIVTYVWWED